MIPANISSETYTGIFCPTVTADVLAMFGALVLILMFLFMLFVAIYEPWRNAIIADAVTKMKRGAKRADD